MTIARLKKKKKMAELEWLDAMLSEKHPEMLAKMACFLHTHILKNAEIS
jgi:hypothetical protein